MLLIIGHLYSYVSETSQKYVKTQKIKKTAEQITATKFNKEFKAIYLLMFAHNYGNWKWKL